MTNDELINKLTTLANHAFDAAIAAYEVHDDNLEQNATHYDARVARAASLAENVGAGLDALALKIARYGLGGA